MITFVFHPRPLSPVHWRLFILAYINLIVSGHTICMALSHFNLYCMFSISVYFYVATCSPKFCWRCFCVYYPLYCYELFLSLSVNHYHPLVCFFLLSLYTLGKKGCYTPIEDNKTNVDRTFVFPLGWNWHDMDLWLFPNEIRHYLGQTFNARSSGIAELRNHSIGGRSPKSIFTLWQLWITICIFFKSFSDCSNNAPSNPYGY